MARHVTAIEFFSGIGGWHSACKNVTEIESLLARGDLVTSVSSSSSSSSSAAAAAAGLGGGGGEEITFTNTTKKCSQFQIEITQAFDINTLCNDVYHLNYGGKKPSGRSIQVYLHTTLHFILFFMLSTYLFSILFELSRLCSCLLPSCFGSCIPTYSGTSSFMHQHHSSISR